MTGIEHYLSIFTKAVFIENIVLAYFLGLCSFLAISKKIDASVGIGLAVIVVLTITAPINWFLWEFLLDKGALVWISSDFQDTDLGFLKLIVFSNDEPWSIEFQKSNFIKDEYINFTDQRSTFIIPRGEQVTQIIFETIDGKKYGKIELDYDCLLYTSPSPRDRTRSRMPSSA